MTTKELRISTTERLDEDRVLMRMVRETLDRASRESGATLIRSKFTSPVRSTQRLRGPRRFAKSR